MALVPLPRPTYSIVVIFTLSLVCAISGVGQTNPDEPKATKLGLASSESVENGVFRSVGGKFSIAIAELPKQTLDQATEKAKAKGLDVGKQFVWVFDRTLYTLFYDGPFDKDGNPYPQRFEDMENGTRKGILNAKAALLSEKPIKLGKSRGTEFRYVLSNGVRYINRST